jgi:N-formylglutamate amidohydrolase
VLSVPHAGRHYPVALDAARAVGWRQLHELEDRYVDRLIGPAVADGAIAIVATHARAFLDLNRDESDRDHAPASVHGRAGLGLVPGRIAGRPLWRHPVPEIEIRARVAALHRPYHAALAAALAAARRRFGFALLIDCHSMPPITSGPGKGAQRVIGDRHGASAAPTLIAALLDEAQARGIAVTRNTPYAGAYILTRHGRPVQDLHAVQLEFCRSLYLDTAIGEPSPALGEVAELLAALVRSALDAAWHLYSGSRLAAE